MPNMVLHIKASYLKQAAKNILVIDIHNIIIRIIIKVLRCGCHICWVLFS